MLHRCPPILLMHLSYERAGLVERIPALIRNGWIHETDADEAAPMTEHTAMHRLLGRALTRYALARAFPGADCCTIARSRSGKPYLMMQGQRSDIGFSVSHSKQDVVVAVSRNAEVGVDIERPRRMRGAALAHAVSMIGDGWLPDKWEALSEQDHFCARWVLYEAHVKASGIGAVVPLPSVTFAPIPWRIALTQRHAKSALGCTFMGMFSARCGLQEDGNATLSLLRTANGHWLAISQKTLRFGSEDDEQRIRYCRVALDALCANRLGEQTQALS